MITRKECSFDEQAKKERSQFILSLLILWFTKYEIQVHCNLYTSEWDKVEFPAQYNQAILIPGT